MDSSALTFVMYLIHQLAESWEKTPASVYQILKKTNVLTGYILPCYDVLHTLGKEYLVEDISELVEERGGFQ